MVLQYGIEVELVPPGVLSAAFGVEPRRAGPVPLKRRHPLGVAIGEADVAAAAVAQVRPALVRALEVTQPPQGALLPGSWTIQQPAFSGDCGVTHFLGLVVLTG